MTMEYVVFTTSNVRIVKIMLKTSIYVRVSTDSQTYEQQIESCKNYCRIKGWLDVDIYKEVESSAKARPVFTELLRMAREGKYRVIVVFRLDRAWRSSRQFIMDFDNLKSNGVSVISVMEGLDPTTPIGEAMMTIIVALAQLERINISVATKQRLDAIRKFKHIGRKKGSKDKRPRRKSGYYNRWSKQSGSGIREDIIPETIHL